MTRFRRQIEYISEPSCANYECLEIKVKSRSVVSMYLGRKIHYKFGDTSNSHPILYEL